MTRKIDLTRKTLVFIMAGGKGQRLYPLTRDRAKPAVPFGGIYRIIDFTLSNCLNSDLRKIYILTQYKSISLERHIHLGWNIFNRELGEFITIIPAQQRVGDSWYQGTADALYQNIYSIEREKPEWVLILAGDHIYKMDYEEMIKFHIEKGAEVTVGAVEVPRSKTAQLGVMIDNEKQEIVKFVEKSSTPPTLPGKADTCLASMGIYVFNRQFLEDMVSEDHEIHDSEHDFGRNIVPRLVGRHRVYAYDFKDENKKEAKYWRDIGTLDAYWEANMDLVAVDPIFNLYDQDWPIRTYQEQYPPVKTVFAQVKEGRLGIAMDSLVSQGVIISGGKVERSVISPGVRINSYAQVSHSILMDGAEVGRHVKLKRVIVDKYVKIPSGMTIGYDLEKDKKLFTVSEGGIVVVPKEMALPGVETD
jgi:glucose-1-phosphate adenylyltransferase